MLNFIALAQRYARAKGIENPDVSIGLSQFDDSGFSVVIRIGEVARNDGGLEFTGATICTTWLRTHDNPWQPDAGTLKIMFDMVDQYVGRCAMKDFSALSIAK